MANFPSLQAANGWMKLPSGLTFQWVTVTSLTEQINSPTIDVTKFYWPIVFPHAVFGVFTGARTYVQAVRSVEQLSLSGGNVLCQPHSGLGASKPITCVFAVGY